MALCFTFSMSTSCASTSIISSNYEVKKPEPSQIIWSYEDKLQARKNGNVVGAQPDWEGLSSAVTCLPKAVRYAKNANSAASWGTRLAYVGIATVVGAAGLLALDASSDADSLEYLKTSASIGGLGLGLFSTGVLTHLNADSNAIDAVNYYNDHYESVPGCQ